MDFEDFKFVPYAVEMVLSLSQFPQSPILPASSPRTSANYRSIPTKFKSTLNPITILTAKQRKKNHSYAIIVNAAEEQQQQPTTTESEPAQKPLSDEQLSGLGTEIKKAMMDREIKKDESVWVGVVEEIGRIEWPGFNKVLGMTRLCSALLLVQVSFCLLLMPFWWSFPTWFSPFKELRAGEACRSMTKLNGLVYSHRNCYRRVHFVEDRESSGIHVWHTPNPNVSKGEYLFII